MIFDGSVIKYERSQHETNPGGVIHQGDVIHLKRHTAFIIAHWDGLRPHQKAILQSRYMDRLNDTFYFLPSILRS